MQDAVDQDGGKVVGARFGKYRIVRKLGEGAFGAVYEALFPGPMGFEKRVAIKRLRPQLTRDDPRFIQSMSNEARIGGRLHHANIVDVYEFDEVEGQHYLAMEFIDGATLEEILTLCRKRGVPLPRWAGVDVLLQVCKGLASAHDACERETGRPLNVIHRDLKPSNIILDRSGTAKILDFGIARSESNLHRTTMGVTKGTPPYMSPEQVLGKPLTPASDIFSLGAIFFELVTGRALFWAVSLAPLLLQVTRGDLSPQIAEAELAFPGTAALLDRALERSLDARFPDARALAAELRKLQATLPVPEADLAEVVARLLPVVDRTHSRVIVRDADLTRDQEDAPELDPDQLELPESEALEAAAAGSAEWARFTSAFGEISDPAEPFADTEALPHLAIDPGPPGTTRFAPATGPQERRPIGFVLGLGALLLVVGLFALFGPHRQGHDAPEEPAGIAALAAEPDELPGVDLAMPTPAPGTAPQRSRLPRDERVLPRPTEIPVPAASAPPTPAPSPASEPATPNEGPRGSEPAGELTPGPAPSPSPEPAPSPRPGTLSVAYVRPWATIHVDGRLVDEGNNSLRRLPVDGGTHEVRLICPDLGNRTKTFTISVDGNDAIIPCWDFHEMAACSP